MCKRLAVRVAAAVAGEAREGAAATEESGSITIIIPASNIVSPSRLGTSTHAHTFIYNQSRHNIERHGEPNSSNTKVLLYVQRTDGTYQNGYAVKNITTLTDFLQSVSFDNSAGNTFYVTAIQSDNGGAENVMGDASGEIIQLAQQTCPTDTTTLLDFGNIAQCAELDSVILSTLISSGSDTLDFKLAKGLYNVFIDIPKPFAVNGNVKQPIGFKPQIAGTYRDTLIITDVTTPSCPPIRIPLFGELDLAVAPSQLPIH